jgi:hypothetical protein
MVMKGINWLAGPNDSLLVQMLKVPPLQFTQDTGLYRAYSNILNFVNGLFVLVFLVIIFASLINDFEFLDNYTIKQTLPRLIAAIILAQFGFFLCAAAIDIGNILGTLLPNTIASGVLGANAKLPGLADSVVGLLAFGNAKAVGTTTAVTTNLIFGGGTGIVFILLFLMAIAVLFSLLLAFIYMVARYLILILLVLAAPLAFLAWVLPGTQPFFFKWGKNLIRLILMYPLVVVVVTTAEIVAFLLQHPTLDPNIYTDDRFKLLIGGLIPFVALLMIPKLLKLSGDMVELTGGAVAGFVAGKVANKDHVGTASKYGKEGVQNSIAYNDKLNKTAFGRFAVAGVSGLSKNSAAATAKMGQTRDRAQAVYDKAASLGTTDELKAMLAQNYTPAKIAALAALAKKGERDIVRNSLSSGMASEGILKSARDKDFEAFKGMPDLRTSWDFGTGSVKQSFYEELNASTWSDAIGPSQKEWVMNSTIGPDGKTTYSGYNAAKIQRIQSSQWNSILQDKEVRKKMNEDVRKALHNYASHNNTAQAVSISANMNADGSWK